MMDEDDGENEGSDDEEGEGNDTNASKLSMIMTSGMPWTTFPTKSAPMSDDGNVDN